MTKKHQFFYYCPYKHQLGKLAQPGELVSTMSTLLMGREPTGDAGRAGQLATERLYHLLIK